MQKFILGVIIFFTVTNIANATGKPKVAVMDLGAFESSYSSDLNTKNIGAMASDYIIEALAETGKFTIIDKETVAREIDTQKMKISGVIPPSIAKEIAAILNVDYMIYGNINSVDGDSLTVEVVSNGGKFHSVKVRMIVRMMKISTGDIVTAAKGEGVSKSSELKIGKGKIGFITVGKNKIPQVSVHNATKKAAFAMVDNLIKNFSE